MGWQTESALLPSKAKPIHVDNKSMVGLKSILLQQEQQRAIRLAQEVDSGRKHHSRQLRGFGAKMDDQKEETVLQKRSRQHAFSASEVLDKTNTIAKSPNTNDDTDNPLEIESRARLALEAKAKLYDALQQQNSSNIIEEENCNSITVGDATLIDFAAKRQRHEVTDNIEKNDDNSNNYYQDTSHNYNNSYTDSSAKLGEGKVIYGAPKYQWSTGSKHNNTIDYKSSSDGSSRNIFQQEYQQEKQLKRLTEEHILQHTADNSHSNNSNNMSQAARVKSQWEKNLSEDVKVIAAQVHLEAEASRRQRTIAQNFSTTDNSSNATDDHSSSNNVINSSNSTSAHNERLELLRSKRAKLLAAQQQQRGNENSL